MIIMSVRHQTQNGQIGFFATELHAVSLRVTEAISNRPRVFRIKISNPGNTIGGVASGGELGEDGRGWGGYSPKHFGCGTPV